jgi:hypothetical protein
MGQVSPTNPARESFPFFFFACPKEKEPKKGTRVTCPPAADALRVLEAAGSLQTHTLWGLRQCKLLFRHLLRFSAACQWVDSNLRPYQEDFSMSDRASS